ncbi:hypothetical protein CDAR_519511 [Caerostris darwini]|uniref:Uncharacterized protein n=1 Tax=Caerostris darwini TaxID=1538125 RepID=A0AAV4TR86_9ARAC|nr:hypothetical protein CDAR_519511 [Caerostris darwini]
MATVGFEPIPPQRLVSKPSALDHSATLPTSSSLGLKGKEILPFQVSNKKKKPLGRGSGGFEPTPPQRLVPKTSALDHWATLPTSAYLGLK